MTKAVISQCEMAKMVWISECLVNKMNAQKKDRTKDSRKSWIKMNSTLMTLKLLWIF